MIQTTRRLEFKQGSSNKFYEVRIDWTPDHWSVNTKWGRIGTTGTERSVTFNGRSEARRFANRKISEKLNKGYIETTSGNWEDLEYTVDKDKTEKATKAIDKVPGNIQKQTKVKLPRVWSKLQKDLLPGERAIYEKHDDNRTSQRRKNIASKWKVLVETTVPSEETTEVRKSAWLYLRYTYLRYLANVNSYTPAVQESAQATVSLLRKKLQELPDNQKAVIDAALKKYSDKTGPLSLAECEAGVNNFIDTLTLEIKEKEKVGLGGVSRKRAKMLARRLSKSKE